MQISFKNLTKAITVMVGANSEQLLEACRCCGQQRVVRVLWNGVYLSDKDRSDIESGHAILASPQVASGNPAWLAIIEREGLSLPATVCVACSPKWLEVSRLAMQDYEWQLVKEEAVANQEFESAIALLKQQEQVQVIG